MLRCRDNSIYTGITNDIEKRIKTHISGKGAKYLRGRLPFELVYKMYCLRVPPQKVDALTAVK